MDHLVVKNFGPIKDANVTFGDLTLLVGPQASGKSIFLQLFKLITDKQFIRHTVEQYNYVWTDEGDILNLYFGDGLNSVWKEDSSIVLNKKKISRKFLLRDTGSGVSIKDYHKLENVFYIPAQRVLSLAAGTPRGFMDFDDATPYVLRYFSDLLRRMLQHRNWDKEIQFPRQKPVNKRIENSFKDSIYQNGKIVFDARSGQKKFSMELNQSSLPYMTWSSGQKEFLPLLMSFYWLADAKNRRDNIRYVVLEEPEMGLHPQAIQSIIQQVIDLMGRGYKVIISTHSPVLLEFAWAFQILKENKATGSALAELFNVKATPGLLSHFEAILKKDVNTFYFDRGEDGVQVANISTLDAGSENSAIAEWGGLSSFATRAGEIVSKNVSE